MRRAIVFLFALFCAGLASQAPEFAQQYRQRLGGAVDELARIVRDFDADASGSGLTRAQALDRYPRAGDPFLADQGRRVAEIIARFDRLWAQKAALDGAMPILRPVEVARRADGEVMRAAFEDYEPAVPVTPAGFIYAAAGALAGGLLAALLTWPFARVRRRYA
jgi:hypothetical protein